MRPQLPNRPLLLSTTFTIAANSAAVPPDEFALVPAFDEPLFLDEIRFNYLSYSGNIRPQNDVRVELLMGGSQSLTHLPVPLAALNTSPQPFLFSNIVQTIPALPASTQGVIPRNGVTFRLPRPMYLNAGNYVDRLYPKIHNNTAYPITMSVSYACRRAEKGIEPAENWYPYIASYTTPQFQIDSATQPFLFESTANDLVNPYSVPILVDRLVGFIGSNRVIGQGASNIGYPDETNLGELIYAKMLDSNGNPVVRDITIFNALFNLQNNAWQGKGLLYPHEYLITQVTYENNLAQNFGLLGPPPPPPLTAPLTTANVVMIASRRADKAYTERPLNDFGIPQQPGRPPVVEYNPNLPRLRKV
jgi:hypothetical protein